MHFRKNVVKFLAATPIVCIALSIQSAANNAEAITAENDSISKQIAAIFAEADELAAQRQRHSRQYLMSLRDDELARLYMPVPFQMGISFDSALKAVKEDRQKVIEQLTGTLNEQDAESFRLKFASLVNRLSFFGPQAVPILSARMGDDYRKTGHSTIAKKALLQIGPAGIESLIPLINSPNDYLRANVTYVLAEISDPSVKDALLRAVSDKFGQVRYWAIYGLLKLGPKLVGQRELIALLIDRLQDSVCLQESIGGLERYGDETAIEQLRIIERFYVFRGKGDLRYSAGEAINSILRRAGKPTEEVSREHYSDEEPSYDELKAAAVCANVCIRCSAIDRLSRYRNERTAMFLIERWQQEQNPQVLDEIARTFCSLVAVTNRTDTSEISKTVLQKAFDAFISVPETKPVLSTNILRACERRARIHDFIPPDGDRVLEAAVTGGRAILNAAGNRDIKLERVDLFKTLVRGLGISSEDQSLRNACYSAVTAIAMTSAKAAVTWSARERNELQEQLSPLLGSPNPSIRLTECLGHIGDKRLTLRFIELLGHGDSSIRRFAAHALGRIGDSRALPALERLAETDPYQYRNGVYGVREAAREAIERINAGLNNSVKNRKVD